MSFDLFMKRFKEKIILFLLAYLSDSIPRYIRMLRVIRNTDLLLYSCYGRHHTLSNINDEAKISK